MQSTISRFACRILVERDTHKSRIYAAGFDSSRNIFLGVRSREDVCHLYALIITCAIALNARVEIIILSLSWEDEK